MSTCRLCTEDKELLKKSHVIPDFMYKGMYDKSHKINKLAPQSYIKGHRKIQRPSTGEYESNILCQRCDNEIIGSYEAYGNRVLYAKPNESSDDPIPEHGVTETGIPVTRFSNVDYGKFKLFLLSIVWRASISTRQFFKDIDLGPYEHEMRSMILQGNPGKVDQFPIILISWALDDSIAHDFVAEPGKNRLENGVRYVFIISGMTYVFYVSPNSIQAELLPFTILPSNMLSVLYIPKGRGKELFASYFGL